MLKTKIIIIAISATLIAVFWQELNLYYLNNNYPVSNGLISSADEASYLRPPQNLLKIGVWKGSTTGKVSHFMRPPGFGIYFLLLKIVFGTKVWLAMKIVQIVLSFLSIIYLFKSLELLKISEKVTIILTSLFAFLPCYSGFMYFTITESISPFFMILSTYYWLKISKNKTTKFTIFGFVLIGSFLILIRPQLIVFIALFYLFLFVKLNWKNRLIILLTFLPFLMWNIRTFSIAEKWMGIHPIYHKTNNSVYRPNHEKMTNLFRIWENRGDVFHSTISLLARDSSQNNLNLALQNVPKKYQKEVKSIFQEYQQLEFYRQSHFKDKAIYDYFEGEHKFGEKLDLKINDLISKNKADYYLITPFKSFKKLVVSSQLNLSIFQYNFRGQLWCEFFRWLCLFVLVISYTLSFFYIFKRKWNEFLILSFGIMVSFFYLSYVQRMNEERYLTPILPLALLVVGGYFMKSKSKEKEPNSI